MDYKRKYSNKAKENKRVMKTVVFFEKIITTAKCYCPDGFYQAD